LEQRRWVLPIVLVAVGLVWVGQGLGLLRGSSFMVDDERWAIIGLALVAAGAAVAWRTRRSARL
jgi:MYXO-CTERM domain-containing protein